MQNSHQSIATERAKQPSKHSYRAHETQSEPVTLQSKPRIDWQSRLATELTGRVVLLQSGLQEYTRLGIAAEPSPLTATEHAHVMRATP